MAKKRSMLCEPFMLVDGECMISETFDTLEEATKQAEEYARENIAVTLYVAAVDYVPTRAFKRVNYPRVEV